MKRKIYLNERLHEVEILDMSKGRVSFLWEGVTYAFSLKAERGEALEALLISDDRRYRHHHVSIVPQSANGSSSFKVYSEKAAEILLYEEDQLKKRKSSHSHSRSGMVTSGHSHAPMPGRIFKILKKVGDEVFQGETLLLMEAMKMEHAVKAGAPGKIEEICCQEQDIVALGAILVKIKIRENENQI